MLIEELSAHAHERPAQAAVVTRMLDFLDRHGDRAFVRENTEGHFCGSAWVVDPHGSTTPAHQLALLTHHRKLGRWLQLGGHADGEVDLRKVALTEAHEESGLQDLQVRPAIFDVDIHEIPARPGEPAHLHLDVRYAILGSSAEPLVTSAESHALAWVPIGDLRAADTELSIARMARYWCGEAT